MINEDKLVELTTAINRAIREKAAELTRENDNLQIDIETFFTRGSIKVKIKEKSKA